MANNTTADRTWEVAESIFSELGLSTLAGTTLALILVGVGLYAYFFTPLVRTWVNKFTHKHDDEILALLDEHLTKAQKVAYKKLETEVQARVNNAVLRDTILALYDHTDDKAVTYVKSLVRAALKDNK